MEKKLPYLRVSGLGKYNNATNSRRQIKRKLHVSFQRLHSHLKCLSNNDLKGSRTEEGFKRAFATLFGQDLETFTGTMFLYMDQLQKQLDNEEFQENGSMSAFKVLETQFQMFIKSRFYLDDEYVDMTRNKLPINTLDSIFKNSVTTLIQLMESTTEEKTDTSNALDALDASSCYPLKARDRRIQRAGYKLPGSGNDAHVDDADIRPIYNEEPMAEVQMTADDNVSATGQQHTEQPEFINEGEVDQNAEQCHDICPLPAKLTDDKTTELSNQSLESENVCLKKNCCQCQKDFCKTQNEQLHKEKEHLKQTYKDLFDSIKSTRVQTKNQNDSLMEQLNKKSNENADVLAQIQKKGFAIAALKNELRKLTGNSVNTKFAKPSILGKPVGQPLKNQSVVRQPTAFKSERPRISKPRFASQVDVNNDLSKPVTTHHLPKRRESAPAKPHYMIATSSSRASRNFDLMITKRRLNTAVQASVVNVKWHLLKITLQAPSGLVLHQMTSDHNHSELRIQDHSNEQSSSKLVPKVVP
ncbi:retrovirus-related pol polyprotein from transposon TNT 1-94 [Tanacetum coccineum]